MCGHDALSISKLLGDFDFPVRSIHGSVDRRSVHGEQFGEFVHRVLAGGMKLDQVRLLLRAQFGLFAAKPSLGSGHFHPLAGAHPDEGAFELGDHRPDLKQLVWILTVAADGAVPVAYRLSDGNTTDDQTHVPIWVQLVALLGRADFLY